MQESVLISDATIDNKKTNYKPKPSARVASSSCYHFGFLFTSIMNENELKKEQVIAKAMENKKKFEIHKRLIEEYLCIGGEMYIKDLKVFYERQVVDNQLLLNLMEYAESFAKEYSELQASNQAE